MLLGVRLLFSFVIIPTAELLLQCLNHHHQHRQSQAWRKTNSPRQQYVNRCYSGKPLTSLQAKLEEEVAALEAKRAASKRARVEPAAHDGDVSMAVEVA